MKALKMIFALIMGIGAGLGIGMLTAPRSGKRTRDKMMKDFNTKKNEWEKIATKKLDEAKEILNDSVKKQTEAGKKAIEDMKKAATVK